MLAKILIRRQNHIFGNLLDFDNAEEQDLLFLKQLFILPHLHHRSATTSQTNLYRAEFCWDPCGDNVGDGASLLATGTCYRSLSILSIFLRSLILL